MEWPYANKCYVYQFQKDITTGICIKNLSVYISSTKIKFLSLRIFHLSYHGLYWLLTGHTKKLKIIYGYSK